MLSKKVHVAYLKKLFNFFRLDYGIVPFYFFLNYNDVYEQNMHLMNAPKAVKIQKPYSAKYFNHLSIDYQTNNTSLMVLYLPEDSLGGRKFNTKLL